MRDDVLLEWIGKNYFISPVIPVLIGSCYLVSYLAPLGPNVIQAISYVDIINFSLLAILLCMFIGVECLILYFALRLLARMLGIQRPSRKTGMRAIYALVVIYLITGVFTYFAAFDFYDRYLDFTLLFVFVPLIYLIVVTYYPDTRIIISAAFLVGFSFVAGQTFGYLETTTLDPRDQVCSDTCRKVDVYVVLSAYVVAFEESGQVTLFQRDKLQSVTLHRENP